MSAFSWYIPGLGQFSDEGVNEVLGSGRYPFQTHIVLELSPFPFPPQPLETPVYLLCMKLPILEFHTVGIIRMWPFVSSFFHLSTVISRFTFSV